MTNLCSTLLDRLMEDVEVVKDNITVAYSEYTHVNNIVVSCPHGLGPKKTLGCDGHAWHTCTSFLKSASISLSWLSILFLIASNYLS